jgi:hypothetical protein
MNIGLTPPRDVVAWLLEPEDPSIRYRTATELLDLPRDGNDAQALRKRAVTSDSVKSILGKMHPDNYWLQKNPRTGKMLGDGVEYGAFGTTHYCLSYLAELGMDRNHPQVARAAERYLNLQQSDGDFYRHFSCLLGYNIRTFAMLGYRDDDRVRRSLDSALNSNRPDDGYLCDIHEKRGNRAVKSCIRGSVKMLLAFSHFPETWSHTRVKKLVDYFLSREAIYQRHNRKDFVNKDMERNSFPITWRANVFEILLALSRMGYGRDSRLDRAWKVLDSKQDNRGRYFLDWTPRQCPWKVGDRNGPNKWVTFYSYLAHKERTNGGSLSSNRAL